MPTTYQVPNIGQKSPFEIDAGWYGEVRFDVDDSAPNYIGLNLTKGADQTATTWKVYKFTYSGSNVTVIQLAYGAWSNRANLF